MISQIVQVHPFDCTAKPLTKGPKIGPHTAEIPQILRLYACLRGTYISVIEAPPVAKAGEPINPVKKRKARSAPKLGASAVGIWSTTKTNSVAI
jgi:hypothetical protein